MFPVEPAPVVPNDASDSGVDTIDIKCVASLYRVIDHVVKRLYIKVGPKAHLVSRHGDLRER